MGYKIGGRAAEGEIIKCTVVGVLHIGDGLQSGVAAVGDALIHGIISREGIFDGGVYFRIHGSLDLSLGAYLVPYAHFVDIAVIVIVIRL